MARIRKPRQQNRERQINQDIRQQSPRRSQQKHQSAADGWPQQNREIATACVQTNRAGKVLGRHHVMDHQLRRRRTDHTCRAVNDQENHGVPHLELAREEQKTPGK